MRVLAVIPARYGSTRLPGKPLSLLKDKPMIQWVYEGSKKARGVDRLVVATDDERIKKAVESFGGEAILTSADLKSGTDRVAAVAREIPADIYVNIQGDEPMMRAPAIEKAVELVASGRFRIGTVMAPLTTEAELHNPAVVKVLTEKSGRAIYFSRYPIPYSRKPKPEPGEAFICQRHLGLYAFDRKTLFEFAAMPPSQIEVAESLEQLRALEAGISIGVAQVDFISVGVDTLEDLEAVRKLL